MDYEFKKNMLDGSYHVVFSMGHEALGRWLIEEVQDDEAKIALILNQLGALKGTMTEWQLIGEEMTLSLQDNEAIVQANYLFFSTEDEMEEDMSHYDDEAMSLCGFEDLEQVLHAWRAFIRGR
ncbi:YacL family protein [Photobacterium sp. 1_MG-2023]|uniref:YacL family protein n=1 Tax=Photobacterium sp. 1_MG-2023 TaxID=3062646 RepID=UPI0026E1E428|nr:YacL family protein [Photobacterium sp. 1_MG-2023]MDO6706474.1 YacL family protein [Photobacterium sp. 1_MG-2023]